ncbi:MAG: hypothetical protein PF445_13450 [Melioribacteraceae bacterium]|jgi:hypothetical protein|nr:hypothetical protein [Melioribacteraceae bacterium]
MKILILYITLFCTNLVAQNITTQNLKDVVRGVVYQGNEQYLVTENGYIKVENSKKSVNDEWTEYYSKAHGDSTIQNPNTIIEQPSLNIPIQFFLPSGGNESFDKEVKFSEEAFLYDFIIIDENGKFTYKPGAIGIIGNMKKSHKRK